MTRLKFAILLIGIIFFNTGFSQESLTKEEVKKYQEMVKVAKGTYQIQLIDTRKMATVPLSLIQEIEDKRDLSEVVYFYINEYTRVKIVSKEEINQSGFIPLKEFNYISSDQLNNN